MNLYHYSLICFGFCSFFIGLLIWLKRRDPIGKTYFIFSIFNSIWGIGIAFLISDQATYSSALLSVRIADGAATMIPITWLHFVLYFTHHERKYRKILVPLYVLSVAMLISAATPWFIPTVKPSYYFLFYKHPGPIFHDSQQVAFSMIPP
jgi:glucan phosphoethanolaminetransferase (alkaline phosphatase superfamily)